MRVYLGMLFVLLSSIKMYSQSLFDTIQSPVYSYKTQRIDSIESVYVIYAKKDDIFFKIASPESVLNVGTQLRDKLQKKVDGLNAKAKEKGMLKS